VIEVWINVESVDEGSQHSKVHGPYKSEREALEESKDLCRLAGKSIYDFEQKRLGL